MKEITSLMEYHLPLVRADEDVSVIGLRRDLTRPTVKQLCKIWFKKPTNVILFVWLCVVIVCGIAFFLSLTGILDNVLHTQSSRDLSFEVPNQILNALFTLLCIYVHPTRFYHFFLLCRWRPADIVILRQVYCKDGTYKPHEYEWTTMVIIVLLLHVNCFAQYAICGANLALSRSERPIPVLAACIVVSVAAPIAAVIIKNHSSLGKDYGPEADEEAENQIVEADNKQRGQHAVQLSEKRMVFMSSTDPKTVVEKPEWLGGLLDICDNLTVASYSLFCCFCIFGWNMERLGLGNMYVHMTTFLLICVSPFWIFFLASARVEDETFSRAFQLVGVIVSLLGLLHGGIWRIKMRKQYNLPPNNDAPCCTKSAGLTDLYQWLFCCWCSLAQEVRTADYYGIAEVSSTDPPHKKENSVPHVSQGDDARLRLQRNLAQQTEHRTDSFTFPGWPSICSPTNAKKEISEQGSDDTMKAPVPAVIIQGFATQ